MITDVTAGKPQVGDRYHCEICGMEIEVLMPCQSQHPGPEFRCCNADMRTGGTSRENTLTPEAARGDFTA